MADLTQDEIQAELERRRQLRVSADPVAIPTPTPTPAPQPVAEPKADISKAESALTGAAQGATFGFGDEMSAGLEYLIGKITRNPAYQNKTFKDLVDESQKEVAAAKKANPWSFFGGDLGGSLLTAAVPAGAAGKLGLKATTLKNAAKIGAAESSLRAVGESKDKASLGTLADVAIAAPQGALMAAGGQALLNRLTTGRWRGPAKEVVNEVKISKAGKPIADKSDEMAASVINKQNNAKKGSREYVSADDVAYFRANKDRIMNGPSANLNAANSLEGDVLHALDNFKEGLMNYENAAGEMIEGSGASFTRMEIAQTFANKIKELKKSAKSATEGNSAAIQRLRGYIKRLLPTKTVENAKGTKITQYAVDPNEEIAGTDLRGFIQGLWEDNRRFFVAGRDVTAEERAINDVSASLNEKLKKTVGKAYQDLMEVYSADMKVWSKLNKEFKINDAGAPTVNGWFKNRFFYPLQEVEFGNRNMNDEQVKALVRLGRASGLDFAEAVKDQLVFGRLFPKQAEGLQGGTATALWSKAAKKSLLGSVPMVGDVAEAAKDAAKARLTHDLIFDRSSPIVGAAENINAAANLIRKTGKGAGYVTGFPLGIYGKIVPKTGAVVPEDNK